MMIKESCKFMQLWWHACVSDADLRDKKILKIILRGYIIAYFMCWVKTKLKSHIIVNLFYINIF